MSKTHGQEVTTTNSPERVEPKYTMNRIIRKIENALQTDDGQRFLQYAYSFGAAIVIFGAMVKVLHWWGVWGNIIFGTGMAIECIVFILYGLDRSPVANQSASVSPPVLRDTHSAEPSQAAFHDTPASRQQPSVGLSGDEHTGQISSVSDNMMQFEQEYIQQMKTLSRNLSGLNTIYEIQLKSISGQLDSIEQINNGLSRIKSMYSEAIPDSSVIKQETEKMADQLRELNQVYARMLDAMTNRYEGN